VAIEPGGMGDDDLHLFADGAILSIVAAVGPAVAGGSGFLFVRDLAFCRAVLAGARRAVEGPGASPHKIAREKRQKAAATTPWADYFSLKAHM